MDEVVTSRVEASCGDVQQPSRLLAGFSTILRQDG
jgi:hypothetical protein